MADLLRDELCLAGVILPCTEKKFAQKWIQRFLFAP